MTLFFIAAVVVLLARRVTDKKGEAFDQLDELRESEAHLDALEDEYRAALAAQTPATPCRCRRPIKLRRLDGSRECVRCRRQITPADDEDREAR